MRCSDSSVEGVEGEEEMDQPMIRADEGSLTTQLGKQAKSYPSPRTLILP